MPERVVSEWWWRYKTVHKHISSYFRRRRRCRRCRRRTLTIVLWALNIQTHDGSLTLRRWHQHKFINFLFVNSHTHRNGWSVPPIHKVYVSVWKYYIQYILMQIARHGSENNAFAMHEHFWCGARNVRAQLVNDFNNSRWISIARRLDAHAGLRFSDKFLLILILAFFFMLLLARKHTNWN